MNYANLGDCFEFSSGSMATLISSHKELSSSLLAFDTLWILLYSFGTVEYFVGLPSRLIFVFTVLLAFFNSMEATSDVASSFTSLYS